MSVFFYIIFPNFFINSYFYCACRSDLIVKRSFMLVNTSYSNLPPPPSVDKDSLNHYVITLAPTASKLYVNGVLVVGGELLVNDWVN